MASARSCGLRDRTDARSVVIVRLLYCRTAGAPPVYDARICERSIPGGRTCAERDTAVSARAPIKGAASEKGRIIAFPESGLTVG